MMENKNKNRKAISAMLATLAALSPIMQSSAVLAEENAEAAEGLKSTAQVANESPVPKVVDVSSFGDDDDTSSSPSVPEDTSDSKQPVVKASDSSDSSSSSEPSIDEDTREVLKNPVSDNIVSLSGNMGEVEGNTLYVASDLVLSVDETKKTGYSKIYLLEYDTSETPAAVSFDNLAGMVASHAGIDLASSTSVTLKENKRYQIVYVWDASMVKTPLDGFDDIKDGMQTYSAPVFSSYNLSAVKDTVGAQLSNISYTGMDSVWQKGNSVVVTFKVKDSISPLKSVTVNDKEVTGPNYSCEVALPDNDTDRFIIYLTTKTKSGVRVDSNIQIKIDRTAPVVDSVTASGFTVKDGKNYLSKETGVQLDMSLTDGYSGVKEVLVNGVKAEDTSSVTIYGFSDSVVISDNAGNSRTMTGLELLEKAGYSRDDIVVNNGRSDIDVSVSREADFITTGGDKWYKGSPDVTFTVYNNTLSEVEILVNGVSQGKTSIKDDGVYLVPGLNYSGRTEITCKTTDVFGTASSQTVILFVDTDKPSVSDIALTGEGRVSNGILFASSNYTLTGNISDSGAGVKGYKIKRDGVEVNSSLGSKINYAISVSGSYTVEVEDLVGNITTIPVSDYMNDDATEFIFDNVNPVISAVVQWCDEGGYNHDIDANTSIWYNKRPKLKVSVDDENIEQVTVNGNVVNKGSDGAYTVDAGTEGTTKYIVAAVDKAGNRSETTYTIKYDSTTPDTTGVTATYDGNVIDRVLYTNTPISLSGAVRDLTSGLKEWGIGRFDSEEVDTVSASGNVSAALRSIEQYFYAEDIAGNRIELSPSGLRDDIDEVVFDNTSPTIDVTLDGEDFTSGSYLGSELKEMVISAVDENLAMLKVNGEEVSNYYSFDPSTMDEGRVDIVIEATDKAGNVTRKSIYFINDFTGPVTSGLSISGESNTEGNIAYMKGSSAKLEGVITDNLAGAERVVITDPDGEESEFTATGSSRAVSVNYTINKNGTYLLRAEDKVGNFVTMNLASIVDDGATEFLFDSSSPVITVDMPEADYNNWYKTPPVFNVAVTDDNLQDVNIEGASYTDEGNGVYQIDMQFNTGMSSIQVRATDKSGNVTVKTLLLGVDSNAPDISGLKLTPDRQGQLIDDTLYVGNFCRLHGKILDEDSGIRSVQINGADVELVNNEIDYTFDQSGSYSLTVIDNVGNSRTVSLNDLVEGGGGDSFEFDNNMPVISILNKGTPFTSGLWYSLENAPVLDIGISDPEGNLLSQKIVVRGDLDEREFTSSPVAINTADFSNDGVVYIGISAEDRAGNTINDSVNVKIDNSPVDLSGLRIEGTYGLGDGNVYARGNLKLIGTISDGDGSGIATAKLMRGGEEVADLGEDVDIDFSESGLYTVKVVDKVGNTVSKNIASLVDEDILSFVFDNDAPVASFETSSEPTIIEGKKWFKDEPDITVNISDDYFKSATATIFCDGIQVGSSQSLSNGENTIGKVNSEGQVEVRVHTEDMAGNSADFTYEINIDKTAPSHTGLHIIGAGYADEGVYYVNGSLTLEGTVVDRGSGISRVGISRDGEVIAHFNTGAVSYTFDKSGTYMLELVDNVGNTTILNMNDLVDGTTSSFIFDNEAAEIGVSSGGLSLEDIADYTDARGNWFKVAPVLDIRIDDPNLKSFRIDGVEHFASELDNGVYHYDTAGREGEVFISVEATDKANNISRYEFSIRNDFTSPVVDSVKAIFDRLGDDDSDFKYISGALSFEGNAEDGHNGSAEPSGIARIEVIRNGEVVDSVDGANAEDLSPITEDGYYQLRVYDKVGNSASFELTTDNLLGSQSSTIRFDSDAPVISEFTPRGYDNSINQEGKLWLKGTPTIDVDIEDRYIKSVEGFVNDNLEMSESTTGTHSIDTRKYTDQEVAVKVVAKDKAGNSSEKKMSYWQDNTAPFMTEQARIDREPDNEKGGKVFFKESPSVQFSYNDGEGVGMGTYHLEGHETPENTNGTFSGIKGGEYVLTVRDLLGNETEPHTLAELLGWSGNTVVIDGEAPNAVLHRPVSTYNDGTTDWYNEDVSIDVDLSDNVGLDRAELMINGKLLDTFTTNETDLLSAKVSANTTDAEADTAGGYRVEVTVHDNAGNSYTVSDYLKIDRTAPEVSRFVINGAVNTSGSDLNGSDDRYGFFFDGNGSIEVVVSDSRVTSGIQSIYTKLDNGNWVEHKVSTKAGTASVTVAVPAKYKGSIRAYAVDNVANRGNENMPDGLVSEDNGTHTNSQRIDITLPSTAYTDNEGLPLYSGNTKADVLLGCNWSGIQKVEWGINDKTYEVITSPTNVIDKDKNLSLSMSKILSMEGNANKMRLWVKVTDMTNHVSENFKEFSIDKDAPVISLTWNTTEGDSYYNSTRVATIHIAERNFDPSKVSITGTSGSLGGWTQSGDGWSTTISCDADNDYNFTIDCTDRAGNRGASVSSGAFTIDKTAPVMQVSWDNNSAENGKYYKSSRTATVTVVEHNFDASRIRLEGDGTLSGWSNNGDSHTAYITFDKDGIYSFTLSGSDLADNAIGNPYSSGEFVIDTTKPEIKIDGVTDGTSYKDSLTLGANVSDSFVDPARTYAILKGKNHESVRLDGVIGTSGGRYEFSNFPREELVDDVYTLEVHVVDLAGNETVDSVTFSVNRFGSKFGFKNAELLGNFVGEATDIVVSETNVDQLDIDAIRIVITRDGQEIEVPIEAIKIDEEEIDGKFVYTYTVSKSVFTDDGVYSVQIFSRSLDGTDYTSAGETYDFVLDTTSPEVIISGIETNGRYQEYSKPVAIEIRDLSGVESIAILINGEEISVEPDSEGIYHIEIQEDSNTQNLTVKAIDKAGNEATMEVTNFLVTSNPWAFILNQWWFWTALSGVGVSIAGLLFFLFKRRKSEEEEEDSSIRTSERFTSSSQVGDSSSTNNSSNSRGTLADDDSTSPLQVDGENEKTDIIDE